MTTTAQSERQHWMSVLARTDFLHLKHHWQELSLSPSYQVIRAPEIGLAQVRSRMGGTGNPFNMGDITMTRAVIKLDSGEMGHAYLKGRNKEHAQLAALLDALLQTQTYNTPLLEHVIQPLQRLMSQAANERAEEIATSKVDFFTLVRGEDE